MAAEQLQRLWIETGRAGAEKLYDKAIKSGLVVSRKQAQEFVKSQAEAQVFQPRARSDGKVVATGPLITWQVDVMNFTQFSTKGNGGFRFVVVAVDVFDRTMRTAPMKTKTPEETAKVFRAFAPFPVEVDTDHGNEWGGAFQRLLDSKGIGHREKDPKQLNALAVVDRAIGTLRSILAKDMTARGSANWYPALKGATRAYNNTGHSHLMGSEPTDVANSKELTYELRVRAGEDIQHNANVYDANAAALRNAGAFRTMMPRNTWARAHQPSWDNVVHKVSRIDGSDVIDEEGQRFPVKLVLPVSAASTAAAAPIELRGGRPVRDAESKRVMRPYANALRAELAGGKLALQVAGRRMNAKPGFSEAMKEAKIIGFGAFRRFVTLFPEFDLRGTAPRITVRLRSHVR